MGNDILLMQLQPNVYTYRIKNRMLWSQSMSSPFLIDAMPQSSARQAMIMKLEGNVLTLTVEWMLIDYTGEVSTLVDELTGGAAVLTQEQQRKFLLDDFENKSFDVKYRLKIVQAGTINDITPPCSYDGSLQLLTVTQSAKDAENYIATAVFMVGDVITAPTASG